MGVWDFRLLWEQVQKWKRLAETEGISERDRGIYLRYLADAEAAYAGHERVFDEEQRIKKEGVSMGNVANKQCPMCRSTDIEQIYVTTYSFYQCNACGERFKD